MGISQKLARRGVGAKQAESVGQNTSEPAQVTETDSAKVIAGDVNATTAADYKPAPFPTRNV